MTVESDEEDLLEEPLSDDEIPNAASVKSVRDQKQKAILAKGRGAAFWKRVLEDPDGRKEIYDLLKQAGTFEERFACGPSGFPQVEATWFHAGEQAMGMRLFQSLIVVDRANVFLMMDEHDPRFARPKYNRKGDAR